MRLKKCDDCIKRKTIYCPNSKLCYSIEEKPYFLDNIRANKELDKKDKVIDEMAKMLNSKVIQEIAKMLNSHDIDDDIFGKFGKSKDCSNFTNENLCIDCIKDYFYKKVEGENE